MKGNVFAAALLSIAILAHGYLAWSKPVHGTQNRYDLVRLNDQRWIRIDRFSGKVKLCGEMDSQPYISCLDNRHIISPLTLEMLEGDQKK